MLREDIMEPQINIVLVHKLNEICGLGNDNLIYALVPAIANKSDPVENLYNHKNLILT